MIISWRQHCLMGILLMGISMMVGCTSLIQSLDGGTAPSPAHTDAGPFENALSIYEKGDYTEAAKLFNALSNSNIGEDQYLKTQLASICCRLMLAESPEDLSSAQKMWKDLKYSTAGDHFRVEQTLLEPLIDRLSVTPEKPAQPAASAASPPVPPKKQPKNELAALKKKTAQVAQLQRQLDAVMAENQILKQKIKALEAIDQNIQKKKTEISAPSD